MCSCRKNKTTNTVNRASALGPRNPVRNNQASLSPDTKLRIQAQKNVTDQINNRIQGAGLDAERRRIEKIRRESVRRNSGH